MTIPSNIPNDDLLHLYRSMLTIREVELRLSRDFKAGKLPGPVHLYIGQEAVAVGVCAHLSDKDWVASTHRGHGHFVAKGGALDAFFAEIYGRATGICGGKGGSMHVADMSKGILGANGIVAAGIGLATGAAIAGQAQKNGSVGVAFFGDGASNQGVLSEALNVAALWKLPLILVCENNGFSEFSPAKTVTSGEIHARAVPYGVPSEKLDGNDVLAVWNAMARAVERARNGEGPTLIEATTYRLHGHTESERNFLTIEYRTADEIDAWRQKDPLIAFARRLEDEGRIAPDLLKEVGREVTEAVEAAANEALEAPWPQAEEAFQNMYA